MRVAVIRNADHAGFGGAETFPIELIHQLEEAGHEAFLVSSHPGLLKAAEQRGFEAVKSPWLKWRDWHGIRQLLLPLYLVWQLYLVGWYLVMIARKSPNVLHPQNRDDFVAASLAGAITRRRVVWTDHADLKFEFLNVRSWHKNWLGKILYVVSRIPSAITVVSKSEKHLIEKSIGQKLDNKMHVIYNGTTEKKYSAKPKKQNSIVIGSTSRMVPIKGLDEVITAFSAIENKHAELWLVGDGPERKRLEKQAKGDSRIRFFGHQTNQYDYIASFDIFVLASHTEGFSVSLIEAAMFELGIVATNIGGNPELAEDGVTGLLVPAHNPKELQGALEKLIKDAALRKKLAKNARALYEKSFNFEVIVNEKFIPLYEGKA